jgi:protein O-mannosyl-transferase
MPTEDTSPPSIHVRESRAFSEGRASGYLSLGLVALVFCIYAFVAQADFIHYDDNSHVFENPVVTKGLTWTGVKQAFAEPHASLWVPLTTLSFMADVSLFGMNPGAMHLENVAWHAAAVVLLFSALRKMTGRMWASAFVAGLFAVHPINVESVAWVTERKNVLCAFFWFACFRAYASYVDGHRLGMYFLALASAALALLAKPMAVTLPCTLLLLDGWPLRRLRAGLWGRVLLEKLPFFALSFVVSLFAMKARREAAMVDFEIVTLAGRVSNALISYVTYLGDLLWPTGLAVFYPHPVEPQGMLAGAAAAGLVAISALGVWQWKRRPYLLVGWLWFLGVLVPMIGLVQVGSQARADRFTYIAQIGVFVAITWAVAEKWRWSRRALMVAACAILAACSALTMRQVTYWKDGATLFSHTASITRNNALAHANAGLHFARDGALKEATDHFRASLLIKPDQVSIWRAFGETLLRMGRPQEAAIAFESLLQYEPTDFPARYQRAVAQLESGAADAAVPVFEQILRDVPDSAGAHYHLGIGYRKLGRPDAARSHLETALRLAPNDARIREALETAAQ